MRGEPSERPRRRATNEAGSIAVCSACSAGESPDLSSPSHALPFVFCIASRSPIFDSTWRSYSSISTCCIPSRGNERQPLTMPQRSVLGLPASASASVESWRRSSCSDIVSGPWITP